MKHFPKILLIFMITGIIALTNCAVVQTTLGRAKCGSEEYLHNSKFCYDNTIYDKCGDLAYNPSLQECSDDSVLTKCGSDFYNTSTHYCKDGNTLTAYSTFTDSRDGKTYKYVTIGSQTWMAENLNYITGKTGDRSYCSNEEDCTKFIGYGRFYLWATAMGFDRGREIIQTKHKGICPDGWHIPNKDEWNNLINYVGKETTGTKLKVMSDFNMLPNDYPGTNDYGFSALTNGAVVEWWGSDLDAFGKSASIMYIFGVNAKVGYAQAASFVRCIQD